MLRSLKLAVPVAGLIALGCSTAHAGLVGNFDAQGASDANLNAQGYCYFNYAARLCGTSSPWNGSSIAAGGGGGMIVSGNSAWGGLLAPAGERYFGFVQERDMLTDSFTADTSGRFTLSWLDTNREFGCGTPGCLAENYSVSLVHGVTSISLGTFTPATFNQWEVQTSHVVFGLVAGQNYTFSFQGLDTITPGYDNSAFIDNLALNPAQGVPEPASLVVLGSGLLASGFFGFRKRKKST